jgi:hypothetical protein
MRILVGGATATVRELASRSAFARAHLGHLLNPRSFNRLDTLAKTGLPIAADNDCFNGLDEDAYFAMLRKIKDAGAAVEWVTVPDFVGQGYGTLLSYDWYCDKLDDDPADPQIPLALVGQDGMEGLDWDYFFGMAACLFIGGSTEWKLSRAAADLAGAAKRRGLWVHMGRVNTFARFRHAFELGCDSVDGSGFSKWPANIKLGLRWLRRLEAEREQQTFAFWDREALAV